MRLSTEEILEHLDGVKEVGRGRWIALCPVHPDSTPSLSVARGDRVGTLLRCFSCGAHFREILDAIMARAAGVQRGR
jgi:DNA primase